MLALWPMQQPESLRLVCVTADVCDRAVVIRYAISFGEDLDDGSRWWRGTFGIDKLLLLNGARYWLRWGSHVNRNRL